MHPEIARQIQRLDHKARLDAAEHYRRSVPRVFTRRRSHGEAR